MKLRALSWLPCAVAVGCASAPTSGQPDTPSDSPRHQAALATVVVANATTTMLTIAFRSATPPLQEVIIGRVEAGARGRMAPVPAGEPIVFMARKPDGSELALTPRSLALDAEWTWEIAQDATFTPKAK